MSAKKSILIGAHTSAAGGVQNALLEGQEIGATTIQLFTANQKQWVGKALSPETIQAWEKALNSTGLTEVMSHDSYLINLGSPSLENWMKSKQAFQEEIKRCQTLNVTYLNFHPGAAVKGDPQESLDRIVESLLSFESLIAEGQTRLLLETTAGQGSALGWRFEELHYIIEKTEKKIPIGVCIDTCHIFVAGYDIRTLEGWEKTLEEFDRVIGLKHLYAFHVNDSMKDFGSRVDRHAPLGEGKIGLECFRILMQHPQLRYVPKYLETPGGPEAWKKEIQLLRSFAEE